MRRRKIFILAIFIFGILLIGGSFYFESKDIESIRFMEQRFLPFRALTFTSRLVTDLIFASRYALGTESVSRYDLQLTRENLQSFMENLPQDGSFLQDVEYVSADLLYQGKKYKSKVRVRGDSSNHLCF